MKEMFRNKVLPMDYKLFIAKTGDKPIGHRLFSSGMYGCLEFVQGVTNGQIIFRDSQSGNTSPEAVSHAGSR